MFSCWCLLFEKYCILVVVFVRFYNFVIRIGMKVLVFLLLLVGQVFCIKYDGLRVKFGWSDALENREYFFKVPRTVRDAEDLAWRRTDRPPGFLMELKMYCPRSKAVCALFDDDGFIAGLQVALLVSDFDSPVMKPDKLLVKWSPPALDGESQQQEYWTATQYYVSEESLKAGVGPQVSNGETLQDGAVWVPGPNGKLLKMPIKESELNATKYVKQNCVPNMGIHHYYDMSPKMKCENLQPWFALTSGGSLIGTGFQMIGKLNSPADSSEWFERGPASDFGAKVAIPNGPRCLYEWAAAYGVVSMHIYYLDKPWQIICKDGDSVQRPDLWQRLAVSGARYGTQLTDNIRKLMMI